MRALKKAVDDGDIEKTTNNSYKLSIGLRRNLKDAAAETYKTKPEPESYKGLRAGTVVIHLWMELWGQG